jgi:hypothetical protein
MAPRLQPGTTLVGLLLRDEAGDVVRREGTLFVNGAEIEYFEFVKA